MRKISFLLIILLFSILSISAQTTPTPTPTVADENDVVKISTTLIQVDATVTDKKGNIVRDLKPEDFEIYENGKKQKITNFSFADIKSENSAAAQNNQPAQSKNDKKYSAPLPPVKLKPEQVRRTYALVVDDLGLSFASVSYVKDTLKKFVNEQMQDGDLVAILRVGSGLGALQSFTSDKRQLLAAISKIRWNGMSRTGVYSFEPITRDLPKSMLADESSAEGAARSAAADQRNSATNSFKAGAESDRQSNIAIGALAAMRYVIRGMSELPGRKSIMFFSEGFQLLDYSHIGARNNPTIAPVTTKTVDSLRTLIADANRAAVVFYTFDPRGIVVLGMKEAGDDVGIEVPRTGRFDVEELRDMEIRDSKDSLKILADETGGLAYVDLNRMDLGVKKAVDDQNGYYLIGYQPDEETFDSKKSKFNKLEVKVKRPDLKIRYRSGFFGITDENLKQNQKQNLSPTQKINAALTSPFGAKDINLDLYSIFYNDDKNKNFIRSFLRIDANDLKFTRDNKGKYKATIDIAAMTFGDNGQPVDQVLKGYTLELDEQGYQKTLRQGFVYDFLLPLKKSGAYQFRIALRDEVSDKVGSASQFIEVPDIGKKKLTVSSLLLKSYSVDDWKKIAGGQKDLAPQDSNIFLDTTARDFKRGTVLNYLYEIYNAKTDATQKPQLQSQIRLFHNGKIVLDGKPIPVNTAGQTNLQKMEFSNAIVLGNDLEPGDYILQLFITDAAGGKNQIASQAIDFEITQ